MLMKQFYLVLALCGLVIPSFGQANFTETAQEVGLTGTGRSYGVAFGDYNNDNLDDIYVSRHSGPNNLYRNLGDGTFQDVAASAGVDYMGSTTTSIWGDIDNDGDLDLYLGNRSETNVLYRNNGDGTFTDISEQAAVNSAYRTRSIMFSDVDMDGFIDLYVANLLAPNYLYHNNGDGTFTDITEASGATDMQIAMGAMFLDYDNDRDPDLYLTHDANQPYILYQNNGDGTFTDVSEASNANYAGQGMGTDFGDINNDGYLDIYITNLSYNTLLLNNGDGTFSDISFDCGAIDPGMGWGTTWLDYDNDGWQDIYMVNDSYFSPLPNILYRNMGDNTFTDVSENTNLMGMYGSYGTATSDVNGDGWIDIFVANAGIDDNNLLFINNNQNDNNWLKIKLKGVSSNSSGIGARVEVEAGGKMQVDEVASGTGYASQNSLTLHFGLAEAEMIDKLTVKWPSGLEEVFENIVPNQYYLVTEGQSIVNSTTEIDPTIATISQLAPNPFSDQIHFNLNLQEATNIKLNIFNTMGQNVARLYDDQLGTGTQSFSWDGRSDAGQQLNSGIYFLQLQTPAGNIIKKISFLR